VGSESDFSPRAHGCADCFFGISDRHNRFSVHGSPFAVHRLGFEVGSNKFRVRVGSCPKLTVNGEPRTVNGELLVGESDDFLDGGVVFAGFDHEIGDISSGDIEAERWQVTDQDPVLAGPRFIG
jgi:hypothetical protein